MTKTITLLENYGSNGKLKSVLRLLYKDNVDSKKFLIRRGAIILGIISFCIIGITLIALLAAVCFGPRKGLYQENCSRRSCINNFNLKCINSTCNCDTGYIYIDKCTLKKKYLESCHSTSYCGDNKNLICLDGVCKCNDAIQYWTGSTCSSKSTYQQVCYSNNQCLTSQMLYCNISTLLCLCDTSTRFWYQSSCFPQRTINQRCDSNSQCLSSQNLCCLNGQCLCISTQYWDTVFLKCHDKLVENATCSYSYQCYSPMTCTSNIICQCSAYQYYTLNTLTCTNQQIYNGYCSVDFNCRVDKYLKCQNGLCQCISTYTWSYGYQKCIIPATYNQYCYSSSDCNSALNLICHDGLQSCICPTNILNNYCDCPRSLNNEYYWNGLACVRAKVYGASCYNDFECQTLTLSLSCSTSTHTCICSTNTVYSSALVSCVTCLSGWYLNGTTCNKCFDCKTQSLATGIGNYDNLRQSQPQIENFCGSYLNIRLIATADFSDISWLNGICSISVPSFYFNYFGAGNGTTCPIVGIGTVSTHDCSHCDGTFPGHAIVCVYDLF